MDWINVTIVRCYFITMKMAMMGAGGPRPNLGKDLKRTQSVLQNPELRKKVTITFLISLRFYSHLFRYIYVFQPKSIFLSYPRCLLPLSVT